LTPLIDEPLIEVKVDLDSLYYGASSLEDLVGMTGNHCMYTFDSLRSHIRSSTSSRFSIECGNLSNLPITNRGFNPKKIGFHRLPNVAICNAHLKEALGYKMTIYISFSGTERVRQTNYFYREEMAVINTAMNLAISLMKTNVKHDATLKPFGDQIGRMTKFETKVKGQFGKTLKNHTFSVGPRAMLLFAQQFGMAMEMLKTDQGIPTCMDSKMNGMRFDKDKCTLKEAYVAKAIKELNKGHYFSANLAGIKNVFKERPEYTLQMDAAYYESLPYEDEDLSTNDLVQNFVNQCVQRLYEELRTKIIQIVTHAQFVYYFDIGVDVSSLDPELDLVTLSAPLSDCVETILGKP
jgi:hypothetical protein